MLSPFAAIAQENTVFDGTNITDVETVQVLDTDDELFDQSWFESVGSPVDFDNPEWLAALALLIPLYMIMRSVPPKPKEEDFPFIRLLLDLNTEEQESDKMPWWQRAVNMAAVSAVILAASGPQWLDNPEFTQEGDVLIAVDNGWASAAHWDARLEEMTNIIRHAHNEERQVIFLSTAVSEDNTGIQISDPMDAYEALSYIQDIQVQSWSVDHDMALDALEDLNGEFGATFWLSNGLQEEATLDFVSTLNGIAPLTVLDNSNENPVYFMDTPEYENGSFHITVQRSEIPDAEYPFSISAYTEDDILISRQSVTFEDGAHTGNITFSADLRNGNGHSMDDVMRFEIDGYNSAGAVALIDEQWRPRTVGLAIQSEYDVTSLLGEGYYINIGLSNHANVNVDNIEALIESGEVSVLMVPDSVIINGLVRERLEQWVRDGGTLVRFAGANLARDAHNNDPLLPVDLRRGFRSMEESVLQDGPAHLAEFSSNAPFTDEVIDENIHVTRQILAQPGPETDAKIWARLNDGTPLVSADTLGRGQVVFYHTTSNTFGSDLPLSPLFIDMLVNIVQQSNSIENTSDYALPAMPVLSVLDGYGELETPIDIVEPISHEIVQSQEMGPLNPPGFYGNTVTRYAFNVSDVISDISELGSLPESVERMTYEQSAKGIDMEHYLFAGGLGLLLASQLILFAQQGQFTRKGARRRRSTDNDNNNQDIDSFEPDNLEF